ncbi:TPA: hypothetical protein OV170_002110 [Staphylococcus aureus]|nr:hypothetical protein [Staphylococcus aureus]MBR9628573.1 hypothetical protein [Staphylococcus aureus]MBR9631021.1 hypothetical protein [Staphylococcus aureus]MVL96065.1 hypothetical protein [Staphylococcus aureus]HAR7054309.1 hypothetical protein [Staphylococcus aureus]HCU6896999.1 hypothetical protein [Staphylococcus aureus]
MMTTNYYVESIKLKLNFIMNIDIMNFKKQILKRILY